MRGTKAICQTCPLGTSRLPTLPTVKVMLPGIKGHQVMNVMMSQTCYKHSGSHLLSHGASLNRSRRVLDTPTKTVGRREGEAGLHHTTPLVALEDHDE